MRGRVQSETREPIGGARIWIGGGTWTLTKPLGVSATDGTYNLPHPATDLPNYQWIHVLAEGYRPESRKLGPVVGEKGPTILLHPSPSVRGVVLEQGSWRRLGGVIVQAKKELLDAEALLEIETQSDGTFEIRILPLDGLSLSLRGLGHQTFARIKGDGTCITPEGVPPSVAALYPHRAILSVPALGTALVLVKDEVGKPVAGARVEDAEPLATDAEGRVLLEHLPAGEAGVAVSADGFIPTTRQFEVAAHQETKVDVILKKNGARLYGNITVANGQPEPRSVEIWPGVLGPEGAHCRDADVRSRVAAGRSYSISAPHGEPVRLVVRFEGDLDGHGRIPWFDRGSVTLSYGQSLERNLIVEPLCKLRIEVKDQKGRPVAGASVNWEGGTLLPLERDHFSGTLSEAEATRFGETAGNRRQGRGVTDSAGTLTACVVKGSYKVHASHGDFKPHRGESFPVDGDATHEIALEKALRVAGRLRTWDGQPADGWWVGVRNTGNEGKVVTDGDGAFVLDSVQPGPQKIQVFWPQYIQTEVMTRDIDISEGMGDLELRLPPLPMLRGRVRGFRIQDLGETRLECSAGDAQVGYMSVRCSAAPDANGLFSLGPLPAAVYHYSLQVQLRGTPRPYVAARGSVTIAPERETTLDLDCDAPGSVSVEIEIPATSKHESYALYLKRPNGDFVNMATLSVEPGAAGKKRIEMLAAPGPYLVELEATSDDRRDHEETLLRESVNLEPSGKISLSATSR